MLFDREILRQNRNRIAKYYSQNNNEVKFINHESGDVILQTILDYKRDFSNILEIGAKDGFLGKKICSTKNYKTLIQGDLSSKMVKINNLDLVIDDEFLPFKENSFDLIISNLNLHFVNNLQENLMRIKNILKPEGMFIASFFGERNLKELRDIFYQTEEKYYGGASPRIIPNINIKTAGMLWQKSGFLNVVSEKHQLEVFYTEPIKLLKDLKQMGESNILFDRSKKFISRNFLFDLINLYKKLYSRSDELDHINYIATFEFIVITGWKRK